jgi:hypothetical protein
MYINPDNDIGIIVLSNGEGDNLYVVDELYDYALFLNTSGVGSPPCNTTTTINENYSKDRKLTKIMSVLGKEINEKRNIPLFYIYDNGTVEKKMIIE